MLTFHRRRKSPCCADMEKHVIKVGYNDDDDGDDFFGGNNDDDDS